MMSRSFQRSGLKDPCPNPECEQPIETIGTESIGFCHNCACPLIFCPNCRVANHLWSAFCRACGREIIGRRDFAGCGAEMLLHQNRPPRNQNHEKRGLEPAPFLEVDLELPPGSRWSGKLAPIDGSVLIFGKEAREKRYSKLFLVHPHMGPRTASLHDLFSDLRDSMLSGTSVLSDKHLYLGSDRRLYRLDLSSIASLTPYMPERHIQTFEAASDDIVFLSSRLLLLKNNKDQCFQLWDAAAKCIAGQKADAETRFFTVKDEWLFAASESAIAVFKIDHDRKEITTAVRLPTPGGKPAAPPVFARDHKKLLLLSSSLSSGCSLYKWALEPDGSFSDCRRVNTEPAEWLTGFEDRYGLLRPSGSYFYDPDSDSLKAEVPVMFSLDLETEPGSCGTLLALPVNNSTASKSISVINALTGQYVLTTGPFSRFAAGPALWGRFLFVLGQKQHHFPIRLYVYELEE